MQKQKKSNRFFTKIRLQIGGMMILFLLFAFLMSGLGNNTQTPKNLSDSTTSIQYASPKQELIFQENKNQASDISLSFEENSKSKIADEQQPVVFTKVRVNDEKNKNTSDFSALIIVFTGVGLALLCAVYYYQINEKQTETVEDKK